MIEVKPISAFPAPGYSDQFKDGLWWSNQSESPNFCWENQDKGILSFSVWDVNTDVRSGTAVTIFLSLKGTERGGYH